LDCGVCIGIEESGLSPTPLQELQFAVIIMGSGSNVKHVFLSR